MVCWMNEVKEKPVVDQISESQSGNGESNLNIKKTNPAIMIEDVNRVLDVGRFLLSVLTEEEVGELKRIINEVLLVGEIGNAGVT